MGMWQRVGDAIAREYGGSEAHQSTLNEPGPAHDRPHPFSSPSPPLFPSLSLPLSSPAAVAGAAAPSLPGQLPPAVVGSGKASFGSGSGSRGLEGSTDRELDIYRLSTSIRRLYANAVYDRWRQDAMNLFLVRMTHYL